MIGFSTLCRTVRTVAAIATALTPAVLHGDAPAPDAAAPVAPTPYSTSWLGNTFGGAPYVTSGGWTDFKHVQLNVDDMFVDTDGTVFTDSGWDEGGNEAAIYKNDDLIGRCQELSHGWGREGGHAVAVDANHIYVAMSQSGDDGADLRLNSNGLRRYPDRGTLWQCVRRFHKNGASAPFPTGYGVWGDMMIVNQATQAPSKSRRDRGYPDIAIRGLAIQGAMLYVSDPFHNQIAVFDTSQLSGTPDITWPVDAAGKIVFDGSGNLWMLQTSASPTLVAFDSSGHLQLQKITFPSSMEPSAIAWDGAAKRMLVADRGVDQNIKLYDTAHLAGSPTKPSSTFGIKGGIHAGVDGVPGPMRFCDILGVGADSQGDIYVASSPTAGRSCGVSLESYHPSGAANWATPLQCLEFVNCVDSDPRSDTDIYTTARHYTYDYSRPAGSGWKMQGVTIDRFKYPDDPRLHIDFSGGVWVRRINGARYVFLTQQMGHEIAVVRLDQISDGEVARPYALFSLGWFPPDSTGWPQSEPGSQTSPTDWIWRDANGDGKISAGEYSFPAAGSGVAYNAGWGEWVDKNGGIWQSGHGHIRHFKVHFDAKGLPVWDYAAGDVELLDPPALPNGATWKHGNNGDDDDMDRIVYDPDTDTMYVSGFITDYPDDTAHSWGYAGRVVYRYDKWSGARTIHPGYPLILPWDDHTRSSIKSIDVENGYLFAVQAIDPEAVTIFDVDTTKVVGKMTPDATIGGKSGWVDMNYGLHAHRRANGDYIVFVEEDLYEKAIIYTWRPPSNAAAAR